MSKRNEKGGKFPTGEERELIRTGITAASLQQAILDNLYYIQGRTPELAVRNDWYMAVAYTVRDRMLNRFIHALQGLSRPGRQLPHCPAAAGCAGSIPPWNRRVISAPGMRRKLSRGPCMRCSLVPWQCWWDR